MPDGTNIFHKNFLIRNDGVATLTFIEMTVVLQSRMLTLTFVFVETLLSHSSPFDFWEKAGVNCSRAYLRML